MKKLYFLISVLSTAAMSAQLTQANHAPAHGDSWEMYEVTTLTVSPGSSGSNATWDFSNVASNTSTFALYTASNVADPNYPNASVAVTSGANEVQYFKPSTTSLHYYGGNISIQSIAATLTYTSPAVYGAYSMSLNSSSTSVVGGSANITVPLPVAGTFTGSSMVIADGQGTLTLPGPVTLTNVIRVQTTQTLDCTFTVGSGTVVQNVYDYYSVGTKGPMFTKAVFTATLNPGGSFTETRVWRNKNATAPPPPPPTNTVSTVGISEQSAKTVVSVFPNPGSDLVKIKADKSAQSFVVYEISGKVAEIIKLDEGVATLDVSSYSNGLYLYRVVDAEGRSLRAGKLTVNH